MARVTVWDVDALDAEFRAGVKAADGRPLRAGLPRLDDLAALAAGPA